MTRYVFDNADTRNRTRFDVLGAALDPTTHGELTAAGVGPGLRCWEVGGGDGGIGHWLAGQVGPTGSVVITDIDPRWIPAHDGTTVLRHDVTRDDPPGHDFDLIHARLVLLHLPQRATVLDRLVSSLKPGGRLVLEEYDLEQPLLPRTTTPHHRAVFDAVHEAFLRVLMARDVDLGWARATPEEFITRGLRDVRTRTHTPLWHGGPGQVQLYRVNVAQLTAPLLTDGVTEADLAAFMALLDNPAFAVWSHPLVSTTGTR
ncbi:class I SAM-dependent methyltransferase [Actinokineospora diospyrosa]|uniref:Methyltransferase domain-containing protein n=1 Tax=Actinokineospora diospyrosa TaxID=103728 RepID=A0ABT1IN02_9PSEU|nr:methyltransferase [Actinokineospora diospyrosa]MCP2274025.1 Methyltransferase domain-containing protein [Actinokineospora diospyrosa]